MKSKYELFQNSHEIDLLLPSPLPYHELQDRVILITGATGLIGSYLTCVLLELNEVYQLNTKVYVLVRDIKKAEQIFGDLASHKNLQVILGDVTKPLNSEVEFDYIVHAAGNNHPVAFSTKPVETMEAAFLGTSYLLRHAVHQSKKVKRFLLLSTGEVYGKQMHQSPEGCKEEDEGIVDITNPRSCYPEAKRAAETLCVSYGKEYAIDTVIARLGYVYGPTMQADSSKADIQFMQKAVRGQNIIMKSSGSQYRSYMYVADAIHGLLTVLFYGASNEAYNIADVNGGTTIAQFAQKIAEFAGVSVVFENPDQEESAGYSQMNREILQTEKLYSLGFTASTNLEEGIQRTLNWLREELD